VKKLHLAFIIVGVILLILATGWGLLYIYSTGKKVPEGAHAGAVEIGGMSVQQAWTALNEAWDEFEQRPVHILLNEASGLEHSWALRQLGIAVERAAIKPVLDQLQKGNMIQRALYRYNFARELPVALALDAQQLGLALRKHWGWLEFNEPANARRIITSQDRIIYEPHHNGYRLDIEPLAGVLTAWAGQALNRPEQAGEGRFTLGLETLRPALTLERLQRQGIERKIASFSTSFARSSEGRAYNVASTAQVLNGWELAPGEVFDYSRIIQAAREHYGFREAPVIVNGRIVPGIGGGICQVSSTLYNAALLAGLEIVERRNHSTPISYVPMGRDATFAEGYLNFRFRNTTGHHLAIRTEVFERVLTVKLFGTMPASTTYRIESKLVKQLPPPTRKVRSGAAPRGGRVLIQSGKPGYVVEVYRIKLESGKQTARELISTDTYPPQATIIGVSAADPLQLEPAPPASAWDAEPELWPREPLIVEDGFLPDSDTKHSDQGLLHGEYN